MSESALSAYARGRVADRANDSVTAVASYRAALTMTTDATLVAFRAYRAGVDGGDYPLALRGAQVMDRVGIVPPDARLLLYVAALRERDWIAAKGHLGELERGDGLEFLAPLLRGWLALGTRETVKASKLSATAYAAENEALLTLARGDRAAGSAAVRQMWTTDAYRASTLRLAAAATLIAQRDRPAALAVIPGNEPAYVAARALIARSKRLPNAVDTPARGTAFVLQRVAADLLNSQSARSAVTLARLATFADSDSPQAQLVLATALGNAKRPLEALAVLDGVLSDPVYADTAGALRIDQLEAAGRDDEAFAAAQSRAERTTNDLTRLGDIEARRGRYTEAAGHYRRAVERIGEGKASAALWLALGNALDRAGDWPAARPVLERALALTPNDARLLNQLGFGMVERGEDLDRALVLLKRADAAVPDNAAITDSIGWAKFRSGRVREAIVTLERARSLDPNEADISEHLGDAYWTAGRRIEARHAWTAARTGSDEATAARIGAKIERGLP